MRENQILIHGAVCEACVFASETDIPSGMTENYMYCEASCRLTRAGKCCSAFIPKRKYKGKVHFVCGWRVNMAEYVCAMCKYFRFLSYGRNVGQCLYRKQYMYGNDRKCSNYVPLPAHPDGE